MSTTELTSPMGAAESAGTERIPEELLTRVLEPYAYKGCRYLTDATYRATGDSMYATGNFSIPESVYIRSTGHFNAVELVLCFNQLAYSAFAPAVRRGEIDGFRGWSIDDYFDRFHAAAGYIAARELNNAAHDAGSYWYTAWLNAGRPQLPPR